MNREQTGSTSKNRSYRNIKLAPTTRAIRSALALSATLLALSGSGVALAGTCIVSGTNEVTCNGVFTDDVTNTVPVIDLVPDLTLVVGDDGATTVDPAAGTNGITSTWGGDATVTSYAEINTQDAYGIYLSTTDGSGTVNNYGSVNTYGSGTQDVYGIRVYSHYDTNIVNGGDVTTTVATGSTYNAVGIAAYSYDGIASVTNTADGSVIGASYGYYGAGIVAVGYYGANVDNAGYVLGSSFTGDAYGVLSVSTTGQASVYNSGTVEAYSLSGNAYGIEAEAIFGTAYVQNSGSVTAGGATAIGIEAVSPDGYASVDNSGTVNAYGNDFGTGILAVSYYDASVNNSGSVYASGYYVATGIAATSYYGVGSVTTTSTSDVGASSKYDTAGIDAYGYFGATVDNAGTVYAYAGGYAFFGGSETSIGVNAYSYYGDAAVTNSGYVGSATYGYTAGGSLTSTGVDAESYYGDATLDNSGTIAAYAGGYALTGIYATGSYMYSYDGDATITNSGSIDANAYGYSGFVRAIGAEASSYNGNATITNSGTITAEAGYYGYYGVVSAGAVAVSINGDASVDNSGSISASTYGYGRVGGINSVGVYALSIEGTASVTNSGVISADSTNYQGSPVYYGASSTGVEAISYYGDASVTNSGTISATSTDSYLSYYAGSATGVFVSGYTAHVDNSGEIDATVNSYDAYASGSATGISTSAGYNSYVVNSGTVNVNGYGYVAATGISAYGKYASYVDNTGGEINVYSAYTATGISNEGKYGGSFTTSSGDINVSAQYGDAIGINSYSKYGNSDVNNSGDITVYSYDGNAIGIQSVSEKYGNATVENSGSIDVHSVYGLATGIIAATGYGYYGLNTGYVSVDNSGTINAVSDYGSAAGIVAQGYYDVSVTNEGEISSSGYFASYGIIAQSVYGDVTVDNSGSIDVYAGHYGYYAYGVLASSAVYGDISVTNSGTITVAAYNGGEYIDSATFGGKAYGIWAQGQYDVTVTNSGLIDVSSTSYTLVGPSAMGVYADSIYGDTVVDNSGTITVLAEGTDIYYGPTATGVQAYSKYGDVTVTNSGSIGVTAQEDAVGYLGGANATGVYAIGLYGNITVDNSGTISATAIETYGGDHYGSATAIGVNAVGVIGGYNGVDYYAYGIVDVENTGTISATATSGAYGAYTIAYAAGVVATGYFSAYVEVNNDGLISATATTGDNTYFSSAIAHGVIASAFEGYYQPMVITNSGTITATATAGSGDYAYDNQADAYGISAYNYDGDIDITNTGTITATASAGGYYGYSNATGVDAIIAVDGYGTINIDNGGLISATAGNNAIGVRARSDGYYANYVNNTGTISATAGDMATGLWLEDNYANYVYNAGLISATGADYNVAINTSNGPSVDFIYNYGTITGALWTGDYSDFLYNADGGVWNPGTTPTDLGAGDDAIVNYGTINMDDSVIHMGTYSVYGNYFLNAGVINVNGTGNWIDMGGPQALVPSLNPLPFYNYGAIDFQDGAADDYLLITGDFAGQGDINVDVSGLHEVSDTLYIDGSVVTGTVQTINVDLLDLPDSIATIVPMVYVSGDSVASNFELGDVTWDEDNSFVTLGFDLIADIDATNATPDVFSLGIEVTGLSDVGTLAASVPGAVESLINSGVGTWRQRMGVIDEFNKGAVSLWARVWQDKGTWQPDHVAANFGQLGNFEWDQKNSGAEAGVDFAVTDEFSVGLLVGKSKAKTDLADPGVGHSDIDADTWGLYGTWISPTGFYLDASYRWTSFDVDLGSVAGPMSFSDNAETFNVEVGYAWTLSSGLKIEPQFQYTKTSLDNFDAIETSSGMSFLNDGGDSSRTRIGVSLRKSFGEADAGWLWTPYVTLSAVHEADGQNTYAINNIFHGETDIGGTSTLLELGFTARHQNWSIYGGLNWEDGGSLTSFFGGQLGVRYTFGGPAPAPAPVVAPPPAKTCADLDDDGDGINNCDDKCLGSTAGEAVGPDGCPVPAPEPEPAPKPYRG